MNLIHLEYFTTVCRLGSMTQAAAVLSVSQPTISAAIRELEREFGLLLFNRVGKTLEITDAGNTLFAHAQELLAKAESTHQIMTDIAQKRNRLRLGITPMLAALMLPRLFREYRQRYPDVEFTVTEGGRHDLFRKLDDRELDMVICSYNRELDEGYQKLRLMELNFGICLNPHHPLANREAVAIADLKDEPLAGYSLGFHQTQMLERMFAAEGLKPNVVFRTSQISTMLEMVSAGLMSCFMYTELQPQRPDLCFLPLIRSDVSDPGTAINLYWRKGDFLYSDMGNLIECAKKIRLDASAK